MIYLFLFFLLLILFYCLFCRKEPFETRKNVILLGDSILQNELYANPSVEDYLKENKSIQTYCYAQDNAVINNINEQSDFIYSDLNNSNTWIFLSIGGNNLLQSFRNESLNGKGNYENDLLLKNIQEEYKKCVLKLKNKFNKCHIVLLNLYYPFDKNYSFFHPLIKNWNSFLESLDYPILSMDFMKEEDDFIDSIEPSIKGGKLISINIINFINK